MFNLTLCFRGIGGFLDLLFFVMFTLALASLAASASAAMARWSCTGSRASLLENEKEVKNINYSFTNVKETKFCKIIVKLI